MRSMVILHVPDQEEARRFWEQVLQKAPCLHVPGMSEFDLPGGLLLGLMPEAGMRRLLPTLSRAFAESGMVRAELYLMVEDPQSMLERALGAGATLLDEVRPRSWGDEAGYALDAWGHVLAFATPAGGC